MLSTLLILFLLGAICLVSIPVWSFSRSWGYVPSAIIMVMIFLIAGVSIANDVNFFF